MEGEGAVMGQWSVVTASTVCHGCLVRKDEPPGSQGGNPGRSGLDSRVKPGNDRLEWGFSRCFIQGPAATNDL